MRNGMNPGALVPLKETTCKGWLKTFGVSLHVSFPEVLDSKKGAHAARCGKVRQGEDGRNGARGRRP